MSYRPWLEELALRQMGGLPAEALDLLVQAIARICEDPYDRLFSMAVSDEAPRERMAEFGDLGFMEFEVDEAAGLVRVYTLVQHACEIAASPGAGSDLDNWLKAENDLTVRGVI